MSRQIKIVFYLNSPTSYQLDFFYELRKYYDIYVLYKNKFSQNHRLRIKKKKWIFFLRNNQLNQIKNKIKNIKPHVLVIGGYKMNIDINIKNIKKFFWLERVDTQKKIKNFLRNIFFKLKLTFPTGIFAIGKEAERFYKKYSNNVYNIPYSIKKKKKVENSKIPKFLFVGQLIKRKGLDKLINDIYNIDTSNCSFTFVGEGPLKKKILDLVKSKKNVYFYNFKNSDELDKIYFNNNILILPSLFDGWGVVLLEAISRGMAVISSKNVGAAKDYIRHSYNGRIFNDHKNSLKNQILFFKKNPDSINLYGKRNIRVFETNLCNVKVAVNKFIEIIK